MRGIENLVYFSTTDGKVLTQQQAELSEGLFSMVNPNKAIIEDGYVVNYKEILEQINESARKASMLDRTYEEIQTSQKRTYDNDEIEKLYQKSKLERQAEQERHHNKRMLNKELKAISKKKIKKCIGFFLAGFVAGSLTFSSTFGLPAFKAATELHNASEMMTEALDDEEPIQDVVARHTHRTQDNKGFWYDNYAIAQELKTLPDYLLDAAIYYTYSQMDPFEDGNIDEVIAYLTEYKSLEDYIKNGLHFVDENGNADIDEFIKYGKQQLTGKSEMIKDIIEEKGGR